MQALIPAGDVASAKMGSTSLLPEIQVKILDAVPADQRVRLALALMNRSWVAMLSRPELWRVVDLSPRSGVTVVSDALLAAITRLATGAIEELDVS